jgi:hypothetical protein
MKIALFILVRGDYVRAGPKHGFSIMRTITVPFVAYPHEPATVVRVLNTVLRSRVWLNVMLR